MQAYTGQCHCGEIRFDVKLNLTNAMICNCSICDMKGAVYCAAQKQDLKITQGEESLSTYQFGTHTAKHHFCQRCGIHVFARPRLDPRLWAVNLRCLDVDLSALDPYLFDGKIGHLLP